MKAAKKRAHASVCENGDDMDEIEEPEKAKNNKKKKKTIEAKARTWRACSCVPVCA